MLILAFGSAGWSFPFWLWLIALVLFVYEIEMDYREVNVTVKDLERVYAGSMREIVKSTVTPPESEIDIELEDDDAVPERPLSRE